MPFRDHFTSCFCGARFSLTRYRAYQIRLCRTCGGAWVEHNDLRKMLAIMTDSEDPHIVGVIPKIAGGQSLSRRQCPFCNKPMGWFVAADQDIDQCDKHGLWFDAGELSAILLSGASPDTDE